MEFLKGNKLILFITNLLNSPVRSYIGVSALFTAWQHRVTYQVIQRKWGIIYLFDNRLSKIVRMHKYCSVNCFEEEFASFLSILKKSTETQPSVIESAGEQCSCQHSLYYYLGAGRHLCTLKENSADNKIKLSPSCAL